MNDAMITKIYNLLNNCLDCAGIGPHSAMVTNPKKFDGGWYVDICIEEYGHEDVMYFVGFLAQTIGMKNIWFDTYPKSNRVHFELVFTDEVLAR